MLMCKVLPKVSELQYIKCTISRLQSTAKTVYKENCDIAPRKYSKPTVTTELKLLSDNFLPSLFSGIVDKNIFQYPAVLREENIHVVLKHSASVEEFLSTNGNRELNIDTLEELAKHELFGLSLPQEYGGAGYNETESKFLLECAAAAPTIARFLNYNENFGCKILNTFGSENQKKKYLPGLAAGKNFISFAYLENTPLIDLISFEGQAILDNENSKYILKATKNWVHSADKSNLFLVMVKLPKFLDDSCKITYKMFLVERNTPGVTIHKLKSENAQEMDVFKVTFDNVTLPLENALGETSDADGFTVLKYGLSHCHVGDATICLYLAKRFLNNSIQYIQEKQDLKSYLTDNLACLTMFTYALESVIYLITGRFDTYDKPDLFDESVLAKIIALDCLQCAMECYSQIFQHDSLKQPGLLEEVLKTWQYYSVFDENIEFLKLMIASDGLVHGAHYLHKTANAFLKPYDNPLEVIKWNLKSRNSRLKALKVKNNSKMELSSAFTYEADMLDLNCSKLLQISEEFFVKKKDSALNNESAVIKFAEVTAYIYAIIACLSRGSSAVCYDFENYEYDINMCKTFTNFASNKIDWFINHKIRNDKYTDLYRMIGKATFKWKGYPAEHPLSRTF